MNIGFLLRSDANKIWGGDIICLKLMAQGLQELGYSCKFSSRIDHLLDCHFVFLTYSLYPLIDSYLALKKAKIPYAVIPFYEDDDQFFSSSRGLSVFLYMIEKQKALPGINLSIEALFERPFILNVFGPKTPLRTQMNQKVFENAAFCLTNSPTELLNLKRDYEFVKAETIFWPAGLMTSSPKNVDDDILKLTNLESKSYLLQVGRIEIRKNQLSSVLATKNLSYPLVFIASRCNPHVLKLLKETILKYRKAPTFIITPEIPSETIGALKIINPENAYKLPAKLIQSAYKHAGLYLHPAFQELPGLTYLEALKFNLPVIASSWTTLKDYLSDPVSGNYLLDERVTFCPPHHLKEIEKAVKDQFGKVFPDISLPILKKTSLELGKETSKLISKYTKGHPCQIKALY